MKHSRPISKGEVRFDEHGELRFIAYADNWLMVRRPGAVPFTIYIKAWDALSKEPV